MDNPIRKEPTELGKSFETQTKFANTNAQFNINEVDRALNEKEESLKKKIFSLDRMEALVHTDPKLSSIYADMSEDGEEKYGYHHNETVMNIIFNDHVLNDATYLRKYKKATPQEKKRRDQAGIDKLKKDLNPDSEKEEKNEVKTHGNFSVVDGFGYDQERDGTMETKRKYDVDETTSAGGAPTAGGGAPASGSGSYETPYAFRGNKKHAVLDKPLWQGGEILENHITDPKLFKMIFESLDNENELDEAEIVETQGVHRLKPDELMGLANEVGDSENPERILKSFIGARVETKGNVDEYGNSLLLGYKAIYEQVKTLIDSYRYQEGTDEFSNLYDLFQVLGNGIGDMTKTSGITTPETFSNVHETDDTPKEEIHEAIDGSAVREYHSQRSGEEPFEIRGEKWQYVNVIDNGKVDIGVYKFNHDIAYSYEWFRENVLGESNGGVNENPIVGAMARGAGMAVANKMMEDEDVNEVSFNTAHGAVNKAVDYRQIGRGEDLSNTYYREYLGAEVNDYGGTIKSIIAMQDTITVVIKYDMSHYNSDDLRGMVTRLMYDISDDEWQYKKGNTIDDIRDISLSRKVARLLSKISVDANPETKYSHINANFMVESIIDEKPDSMARERDGGQMGMMGESEEVNEDGFCRSDELPVIGKFKGEDGACRKKSTQKDEMMKGSGDRNLKQRKKRETEDQERRDNQFKKSTKKKEELQNENIMMDELQESENQMNKLKDLLFEDRKPSSMVNVDRIGKENEKNRKQDMGNSALGDLVDTGEMAVDQYEEIKDPKKMSADLEKASEKESFENVGNSANEKGDEIPKRNHTDDEKGNVDLTRLGMEDITYDNKPDEKFEERMKQDMGEDIYKLRQEKMKHRAGAPMYNKDTTPIEDGDDKEQYNKFKNESYVSGKYMDGLNRTHITNFKLSDTKIVESVDESAVLINTDGMGNTYTHTVNEDVGMRNIMDSFKFYMQSGSVVSVKQKQGLLSEGKEIQQSSVDIDKIKKLTNYNPNNAMGTKKNRQIK